jgi:gamma-F420-2:alpha-L-glutamate ligase
LYSHHPLGIKFLNARAQEYYERKLDRPIATLWLLTVGGRGKRPIRLNYTMKRIFERAYKMNIQVDFRETHLFDLIVSQEGLQVLVYKGQPIDKMPDAVLSRLGAKIDYFGLAVVRHLEKMDVLVLNDHHALETSRDKLHTLQDLGAHNMPIPKTMIAKFPVDTASIQREFNFPIILKHSSGTQGKGVMLIENMQHLNGLSDMVDVSKPMIFQEFISNSIGRDIRVIVVGGRVVGAMMRVANSGFKANFHQGGYVKKIKISQAVEWLALESARLIGLEVAGVDILIDKNSYKICEINSSPGFEGFEMATEVDVPWHILDFVKLRTGVWQKSGRANKKVKSPVVVPVEQEHASPPTSDEHTSTNSPVKDEL